MALSRRSRAPFPAPLAGFLIVVSLLGYGLMIAWAILSALGETPDDEE